MGQLGAEDEWREEWRMTANGHGASVLSDENALKSIMGMIVHHSEQTKNHHIVHIKCVNSMMCELYPNKVFLKS